MTKGTVLDYLKNKTIGDLNNLFAQGTINQEDTPKNDSISYSISYLDAIFEFTSRALKDKKFKENYYKFRSNIAVQTVYRNACKSISNKDNDGEIFTSWEKYFTGNRITLTYETSLKQILSDILVFLEDKYKKTADKPGENSTLIKFLRQDIGISEKDASRMKDETNAMDTISHYIEHSRKKCVIFTGAPGTGKTYCVEDYVDNVAKQLEKGFKKNEYFVQFHSSYDYTDFVEGLRPIQRDAEDAQDGKDSKDGEMIFVRMDGIFKAFCRKVAELNDEKTYYFVIDEINRADLGRVFGELMYCFEKRGEKHKIATQYANLPAYGKDGKRIKDKDDCFKNGFYIPDNVVIIGTMNDIDRSVETFDFALRRRFDWVDIEADKVMKKSLESMGIPADIVSQIVPVIEKMNGKIEAQSGLGKDFKIGPAYFKDYDTKKSLTDNLQAIWEHNIKPILREYVRGRQGAEEFIKDCDFSKGKDGNQTQQPNSPSGTAVSGPQQTNVPQTPPEGE